MSIFARQIALNVSTASFHRISLAAKNHVSLSAEAKSYFQHPFKRMINFLAKKLGYDDLYLLKDEAMDSLAKTVKSACRFSIAGDTQESNVFILTDKNGKSNAFKIKEYYNSKKDFGISLIEVLQDSTYDDDILYSMPGLTIHDFVETPL